jgi:hypothetical protein
LNTATGSYEALPNERSGTRVWRHGTGAIAMIVRNDASVTRTQPSSMPGAASPHTIAWHVVQVIAGTG